MSHTIREMKERDIPAVAKLEREIFPDPWSEMSFWDMSTDAGWYGLVAEQDGSIIGYACFMIVLSELHIANIAVVKEYRRKSVANDLFEHILRAAERRNCDTMLLEVRPSNTAALAFYDRHSFQVLYRRKDYYVSPKEDALVMSRQVSPTKPSM